MLVVSGRRDVKYVARPSTSIRANIRAVGILFRECDSCAVPRRVVGVQLDSSGRQGLCKLFVKRLPRHSTSNPWHRTEPNARSAHAV